MSQLELSGPIVESINYLAALTSDAFISLQNALREAKLTLSVDELAYQVSTTAQEVSKAQAEGILQTVLSLYSAQRQYGFDSEQLLRNIGLSIESQLPKEQSSRALERLKSLLNDNEALSLISKAMDVCTEHDKLFRSVRIITDVRPIFRDDETQYLCPQRW